MANEFNFREKNMKLQEWWEEENPEIPGIIEAMLVAGYNEKITVSTDVARWNDYNIPNLASDIAFHLASMGDTAPIETVIGAIASIIKVSSDKDPVTVAKNLTTAGEILVMLAPHVVTITPTYNGRLIIRSKVYSKALGVTYMYPLPSNKPTTYHKTLGKFNWDLTETTAVDKLNNLAFTVLNFGEEEPEKKDDELHKKWLVRSELRPKLAKHKMYFNWHSDYRGRMYAGGYHFNPQGTEYEKSIIAFAEPEKLNIEGYRELKMAIATAFGQGKSNDGAKLMWYMKNSSDLDWKVAKEKYTARKLLYAMEQAEKTGGYTNIPIELDGTNSQLQMVSVLTGSKSTAQTCNVIPSVDGPQKIADAYGILADAMSQLSIIRGVK